jgi:hypothetical protein
MQQINPNMIDNQIFTFEVKEEGLGIEDLENVKTRKNKRKIMNILRAYPKIIFL